MKDIFPVLFSILFFSVFVWFFMCYRLFKILETRHPEKYEEMGKPSLFLNNTISNNISFMKFLFKGEWRGLNDVGLANHSKFMLFFFTIYIVGFMFLFFNFFIGF